MNRQLKRRNPPRGLVRSRLGGAGRSLALSGEIITPNNGGIIKAAKQSPIRMISANVTQTHLIREEGIYACPYGRVGQPGFQVANVRTG
jgi:hypothetical protein